MRDDITEISLESQIAFLRDKFADAMAALSRSDEHSFLLARAEVEMYRAILHTLCDRSRSATGN